MIFAIPVLTAVAFLLSWCLVKLAVHALPLFAGMLVLLALVDAQFGIGTAVIGGTATALSVLVGGRLVLTRTGSPTLRLVVPMAFAIPASVAAYHAALGLAAPVLDVGTVRTGSALIIAIVMGGQAWRSAVVMKSQAYR